MKFFTSRKQDKLFDLSWGHAALLDCSEGLWDWDMANGQVSMSPPLRNLVGYTETDIKDHPYAWWLGRVHPEDRLEVEKKITDAYQAKSEFVSLGAIRFQAQNGDYAWLEIQAKILWAKNGDIQRIAGVTINVTGQKYLQNQLQAVIANQEKETSRTVKLLSTVSHEFRSPLSGILGMATMLKETPLSTEQGHFIDNITRSTELLLELVNDILDVSKLHSGKCEVEKIPFTLDQVVKKAVDLIYPHVMRKNLTVQTTISPSIPAYLMGDPTRLQQILINLLSNAVKFTSRGGIALRVYEEPAPGSQASPACTLHFEISDTGVGIAPEVQDTLFQDFIQADKSITRLYGGTGLGLSICKRLVELMGGRIGIRSEPGKGSTFWFVLPFETRNLPATLQTPPELLLSSPAASTRLDILLVEDNPVNQEVMQGLLTLLGDNVTLATNGEEAIRVFQTRKFDLVLMDLNMPILDGLKATKAIRALPNGDLPIIAVTATVFPEGPENCHQYGLTQVLSKPINKAILAQALSPYRRGSRSGDRPIPEISSEKVCPPVTPVVDRNTLKTLLKDLGKEKVIRLLNAYSHDASGLVAQIRDSSPEDQKQYAHTLAGMSENLGISLVGKAAREIIQATRYDPGNLPVLINNLENCFKNSLAEIQGLSLEPRRTDAVFNDISLPST